MHLRYPLLACFQLGDALRLVRDQFKAYLDDFQAQPIQTLDRVLLVNTMEVPRLLFHTE